jgi:hypothetical protein
MEIGIQVEELPIKVLKTPSYNLRAIKNYQDKNREKVNEYSRTRWKDKYDNDPEFKEKERQRIREYRAKKRQEEKLKLQQNSTQILQTTV